MKIGISSTGKDLNANVDPRFGRCSYFLIVDTETMSFESISNESAMASGGAGIQAAQGIVNAGVEAVLTGNIGPNAFHTLSAAGIKIFAVVNRTVKEAIEQYKKGVSSETETPSAGSHFGMGNTGKDFRGGR